MLPTLAAAVTIPFLGYSGHPERDLANGFTAAGPVYTDQDEYLERAFKNHWPVVPHVGLHGITFDDKDPHRYQLDEKTLTATVTAEVSKLAVHPEVYWWAVGPEELRPWREDEMRYLDVVVAAIRHADPLKRPIYHYNAGDRDATWLSPVARRVDVLGKGAYANESGHKRDRAWVGWSVRQELIAAAATGRADILPLVMPELYQDPEPKEDAEIRAWARHDVYLGLVAGARGVLIWSLFRRPEVERTWQLWYDAYAECARELNGPRALGRVFRNGKPVSTLTVAPATSTAQFEHEGALWLFLVNSANDTKTFKISGMPAESRALNAFDEQAVALSSGTVTLPAYGVAALRFDTMRTP